MQTFLSEFSFRDTARALDNKRLNKQLLEGRQILTALTTGKGWVHHPATKMWAGHECVLLDYLNEIRLEMIMRGIKTDKNWSAITEIFESNPELYDHNKWPWWWLDSAARKNIVTTHRGRLYEKDPDHYQDYWLAFKTYRDYVCCNRCNYYWPTHRLDN